MSTLTAPGAASSSEHVDEWERELVDALVPRQRSRKWATLIAIAAAGLVAIVAFASVSGTVVPRLSATADSWGAAARGGVPQFTFRLRNDGLRPATITAVDLRAAGLDHGRLDVHLPIHLGAHKDVSVTATFTGLHCNRIDPRQFESGIRVTARGDLPFSSKVTAKIADHFTTPSEGMRTYSGADPLQIGWPAGVTQYACTHP